MFLFLFDAIIESSFGKKGVILHSQAREIVANVINYFKNEARLGKIPYYEIGNFDC